jgi:hypothetical protein
MGKTSDALDEQLATEEMTPMTAEEKIWCEMTLQAVPEDQRKSFGSVFLDVLCVITLSRPPLLTPPHFLHAIALYIPLSLPRVLTTLCTHSHVGHCVC